MKKNMYKSFFNSLIVVALVLIAMTACRREDLTVLTPSVLDFAAQDANMSTFARAIERTGIKSKIGVPLITVFAPTNQAFQNAGITDINAVDLATLESIVNYHIISSRLDSATLDFAYWGQPARLNNQPYQTLNFTVPNTFLYFNHRVPNIPALGYTTSNDPDGTIAINGANIDARNLKRGRDGVYYKIEAILLPPAGLLAEIVASNPDLSLFNRAIRRATQTGQILNFATNPSHLGSFPTTAQASSGTPGNRAFSRTLFAPNNAAMIAAGFNEAAIDAATPAALFTIVARHTIAERCFSAFYSPLPVTGVNQTALSGSINVIRTDTGLTVNLVGSSNPRANVIRANTAAINGVLHIIDRVMQ